MAVTLITSPSLYTPAYNQMVHVVSSDQTAQQNFRYVWTIQVDDDFDGVYTSLPVIRRSPDTTTGYGVLDVHRIIENYVNSNITKGVMYFTQATSSFVPYKVTVQEEYGATPAFGSSITTSAQYAFNGNFNFNDFKSYSQSDWVIGVGSSPSLLNTATSGVVNAVTVQTVANTYKIRPSQDAYAYALTSTSGSCYWAEIRTYDVNGSIVGAYRMLNPFQAVSSVKDRMVFFPVGTNFLASATATHLTALIGSLPAYTSSVYYYSVRILNSAASATSAFNWYIVDQNCTNNPVYRLHFLNTRGGFDSANFIRASHNNFSIQRDKFKKGIGTLSSAGAWSYNLSDRADINFFTSTKQKVTALSDWLSESESLWLQQLFASPEVYYDDGANLFAVNITNTSYEAKQKQNELLFNWQVEFEFSTDGYTQRY